MRGRPLLLLLLLGLGVPCRLALKQLLHGELPRGLLLAGLLRQLLLLLELIEDRRAVLLAGPSPLLPLGRRRLGRRLGLAGREERARRLLALLGGALAPPAPAPASAARARAAGATRAAVRVAPSTARARAAPPLYGHPAALPGLRDRRRPGDGALGEHLHLPQRRRRLGRLRRPLAFLLGFGVLGGPQGLDGGIEGEKRSGGAAALRLLLERLVHCRCRGRQRLLGNAGRHWSRRRQLSSGELLQVGGRQHPRDKLLWQPQPWVAKLGQARQRLLRLLLLQCLGLLLLLLLLQLCQILLVCSQLRRIMQPTIWHSQRGLRWLAECQEVRWQHALQIWRLERRLLQLLHLLELLCLLQLLQRQQLLQISRRHWV
mmetsp:Transcript_40177/g.125202  ORF Transcript_40177/g.125202 Transcript_40177/m.125202 type:complete len:374 (-) Transcript_40177:112-1233(-)